MSTQEIRNGLAAAFIVACIVAVAYVALRVIDRPFDREEVRLQKQVTIGLDANARLSEILTKRSLLVNLLKVDPKAYDIPILAREINELSLAYNLQVAKYNAGKSETEPDLATIELLDVSEIERVRETAWRKNLDPVELDNLREDINNELIGRP